MQTIYFDNSATTKPCPSVIEAVNDCLENNWGNPSSSYSLGLNAEEKLCEARKTVADYINCSEDEIVFTGSGSEANNLALFGTALKHRHKGNKIITTSIEHPSVLKALERLESFGFEIVKLKPDKNGIVSPKLFADAIDEKTVLISVMLVNNEIGSIQNIKAIQDEIYASGYSPFFHCDAVQAFGKLPINVKKLGVDLLSASGHKIHATKGIGFLYIKSSLKISPIIFGGGQEKGLRSGTEPLPLVCGLKAAIDALPELKSQLNTMCELYSYAKEKLSLIRCVKINSSECGLPYIMNISVLSYKAEPVLNALAERGIFVSKGSACSKGHRSYVLSECGFENDAIDSSLRLSFSRFNTKEEIDVFADSLKEITEKLRRFK